MVVMWYVLDSSCWCGFPGAVHVVQWSVQFCLVEAVNCGRLGNWSGWQCKFSGGDLSVQVIIPDGNGVGCC